MDDNEVRLECVRLAADLCRRKDYVERLDCPRHAAVVAHVAGVLSDSVFRTNDAEIIRAAHDLAKKITP